MTPMIQDAAAKGGGPYVRRFSRLDRTLHALVIMSFLALVATGLPLRFPSAPWARALMGLFGGRVAAGLVHRFSALITFGYFFTHLGSIIYKIIKSPTPMRLLWGPDSLVPQPKDLLDFIGMFKWFLGLGPAPKFDRYSYMEKFDYLGVFWGVAIIGTSGLFLWFPEFFARLLPGWAFNIATIIHGDEALLALSFIFSVHFFNVHLRPGKFPIDTVIFTGRATAEYMKEEHPLEYARLEAEGKLAERMVPPASPAAVAWSIGLGFLSLAIGIALILLVVWTALWTVLR